VWPAARDEPAAAGKENQAMMSLAKRNVLGLVIGGVALVGLAAPSAWAQKGAAPAGGGGAAQPEHKQKEEHKQEGKKADKAKVGDPAPEFSLTDTDGKTVKLSDYKGKIVVIDWVSPACPVCQMHYKAGTVQNLAKKYSDKSVVFLGVNSGGAGQPGSGKETNAKAKKDWKAEFPILLDENGKVGHAYGAKTTPHCFVINKEGVLVYNGAIDDGGPSGIGKVNHVEKAIEQTLKGETVTTAETKPYGCGVKYGK
jgi:peroxiredoxin